MKQLPVMGFKEPRHLMNVMEILRRRVRSIVSGLGLLMAGILLANCGGGGGGGGYASGGAGGAGVSPSMVSGVAATGAPLAGGQVTLRDSSSGPKDKVTIVGSDGSFAIDVSNMTAPFVLKATGMVDGLSRTLYSFADGPGTANINPLSTVAVASAAGVSDPATFFDKPDAATMAKARSAMSTSVTTLQSKLKPLLDVFSAGATNPVSDPFSADNTGLDGMFDNVNVALNKGTLTITNVTTGAVIFTSSIGDIARGHLTERDDDLPHPSLRPSAPTGVKAVGGDGQVGITWDPVANATSYDLYYKKQTSKAAEENDDDDDGVHAMRLRNVTSPFVLTGLTANSTYLLRVRALNNKMRGPMSAQVSATTSATTPSPTIPAVPSNLQATGGTQQATVSWANVTGATSYNLYWSTTAGVTTSNGTKITGVTSPAVLTKLGDATTYYYVVTAVNSAGESAASVQVAATTLPATTPATIPPAPTSVTATGGDNQVTLTWPAISGATSYNVYWSTSAGVTTATGTKIAGVTSPFVHAGLASSSAYFYVVTAANSAGESLASIQVTATTNAPATSAPPAPSGLAATGGAKQVSLAWNAVATATSYNLYWAKASGVTAATGTKIVGVTSPHLHTGLTDNTAHFYVVTAVNSAGEGAASAQATATTSAAAIDGAALYTQYCSGCHGALATSDKRGATAAQITSGNANVSSMNTRFNATTGTLIKMTPAQIAAISAALQ